MSPDALRRQRLPRSGRRPAHTRTVGRGHGANRPDSCHRRPTARRWAMYTFATAAMLGLGVLVVATLVERYAIRTERPEIWGVLLIGLGVGAAWLASFNIWDQWRLAVRW